MSEVIPEATNDLDAFAADFFGQAEPAPEVTDTKPVSEPVAERDDVEEVAEPAVEETAEPVEPKRNKTQERIDELVKQREDAKREADAKVEALTKAFEEKLAALAPKPVAAPVAAEPNPLDLNEDGTEKYALGEFDPQYIKDLTRFTLLQERQAAKLEEETIRQRETADAAQNLLTQTWNQKTDAFKTETPDFQEKGQALMSNFSNLNEDYANYLSTVLMSMDKGPEVLYYLANNPAEAVTIVNSGAQRATLALGRIEAKFLEADAQKLIAKPKVSKAPPPPAERARGTNGAFVSIPADTDNLDDFEKVFFAKSR
jgi:hypothetical protein